MYRMNPNKPLTSDIVVRLIEKDIANNARLQKLHNYYIGKQNITNRTMSDSSKPNNKCVNNYPKYITDIMSAYFMGEPISYNSKDETLLEAIKPIFNYNDEQAENAELAKDASIYGKSYELIYLDEDTNIRFKKIDAVGAIPIYDDTLEGALLHFIRYYDNYDLTTDSTYTTVEVYSRSYIQTWRRDLSSMKLIEEQAHNFNDVPIIIYQNNEEELGDFENVVSLIDEYDKLISDAANNQDYFSDCFLVLKGLEGTDADGIAAMKENRVLLLPDNAGAEWLTKGANNEEVESLKATIDENIHKFSMCPRMTDDNFASNASGVAMKYKLMGLENATSKKERAFKKGIQRRIELICNILYILGTTYDYRAIDMVFSRNIPANLLEVADVLSKVGHLLSKETQVALLPIDIDYSIEKERLKNEEQEGYSINFEDTGE